MTGMNPPEELNKRIKQPPVGADKSASWLERNVCHPAWEAAVSGLYQPTANALNLIPNAIAGKDWLPRITVDTSHDTAPADGGEYLSRLLVSGCVGAFAYTAYGRVAGGLLRKGTRLAKLEGPIAGLISSESCGQLAGAAVHDGLLDAPDLRNRAANVSSGLASFGVFELLNKNIRNQHWIMRAIAHAPIGFAGGTTGYLFREGVAGRALDANTGFKSALDGAALNVFLPAMQWTSGRALDFVADKTGRSIPLERHSNYENLSGKSQTLDSLMRMHPATRVCRNAEEGAAIDHTHDIVHVMPKSPADHLAHELAHKLASKKFEKDLQYAAKLLKYSEKLSKARYVDIRLKQEQLARETQLQVAKELLLAENPQAKVPRPEHSHVLPIYKRMFEMEFDEHFQPSKGTWRPNEDFQHLPSAKLEALCKSDNPKDIVDSLYPELSPIEKNILTWTAKIWQERGVKSYDLLFGLSSKGYRGALRHAVVEHYVKTVLTKERDLIRDGFETDPTLSDFHNSTTRLIKSYKDGIAKAGSTYRQAVDESQSIIAKKAAAEKAEYKTVLHTANKLVEDALVLCLERDQSLERSARKHLNSIEERASRDLQKQIDKLDERLNVEVLPFQKIFDQQYDKAVREGETRAKPIRDRYAAATKDAVERYSNKKQEIQRLKEEQLSILEKTMESLCRHASEVRDKKLSELEQQLIRQEISQDLYQQTLANITKECKNIQKEARGVFGKESFKTSKQYLSQFNKAKRDHERELAPFKKVRTLELAPIRKQTKIEVDAAHDEYWAATKSFREPIDAAKKQCRKDYTARVERAQLRFDRLSLELITRQEFQDSWPHFTAILEGTQEIRLNARTNIKRIDKEYSETYRQEKAKELESLLNSLDHQHRQFNTQLKQATKNLAPDILFKALPEDAALELARGEATHALFAGLTFQKAAFHWWDKREHMLRPIVRWGFNLPMGSTKSLQKLGKIISDNGHLKSDFISVLCKSWKHLSPEQQSDMSSNPHNDNLVRHLACNKYNPKIKEFAVEAFKHKTPLKSYKRAENAFAYGITRPDAFPTNRSWTSGNYQGFFLRRDNPLWYFAGNEANCCIRINGVNESGLVWTHHNNKGGMFWVRDMETGETIAVSRTWRTSTPGKGNEHLESVMFNNVESKGLGQRQEHVLNIYKQVANHLTSECDIAMVTVGTGNCDLNIESLPSSPPLNLPSDYPRHSHHDTRTQKLLSSRPNITIPKPRATSIDLWGF